MPDHMRCRALFAALAALLVAGCAANRTVPDDDPWEPVNRGIYAFNNGVDRVLLRPLARGYRFITPDIVERGVSNVFANLRYPRVIVSNLMQGKGKDALSDTGRFVVNSTIGVAGVFDVATPLGMPAHNEDIGQALARWGVGSGPYVVLPFLGPSTVRDGFATAADQALHVRNHLDSTSARDKLLPLEIITIRASVLSLDAQIAASADPYVFVREAYLQRRNYLIYDGEPPVEDELEFEDDLDDFDADL